jgi:hypothetical protein
MLNFNFLSMKKKEKLDDANLNRGLIDALKGMEISKDRSQLISGGAANTTAVRDLALICIGDGCNPACNTTCTICIGASCTTNYG